jgi:hypothetical protein
MLDALVKLRRGNANHERGHGAMVAGQLRLPLLLKPVTINLATNAAPTAKRILSDAVEASPPQPPSAQAPPHAGSGHGQPACP